MVLGLKVWEIRVGGNMYTHILHIQIYAVNKEHQFEVNGPKNTLMF